MNNCPICGGARFASNEMICYSGPICGGHRIPQSTGGQVTVTYYYLSPHIQSTKQPCDHCFCRPCDHDGNVVSALCDHEKCCMCGTRRLKRQQSITQPSPISLPYNPSQSVLTELHGAAAKIPSTD